MVGSYLILCASGVGFDSLFQVSVDCKFVPKHSASTTHSVDQHEEAGEKESDLKYILWLSHAFLFAPSITHVSEELRIEIIKAMPEARVGEELASFYSQYAAWM